MTSMLLRTVRTGLALAGLTVVAIGAPSSAAGSRAAGASGWPIHPRPRCWPARRATCAAFC
ncbi:MAG: hypothetical protein P8Y25_11850, partial [Chromatiaceae bacterium]